MANFIKSSLVDTAGANLTAHVASGSGALPVSGTHFLKAFNTTYDFVQAGDQSKFRSNSAGAVVYYYNDTTPPAADYAVALHCQLVGGGVTTQGVMARMQSVGGLTPMGYVFDYYPGANLLRLYDANGTVYIGTPTGAGSTGQATFSSTSSIWIKLEVSGTSIKGYTSTDSTDGTDGTWTLRIQATDSTYSTAGNVGIVGYSSSVGDGLGLYFDHYAAYGLTAASSTDFSLSAQSNFAAGLANTVNINMVATSSHPASTETCAISHNGAGTLSASSVSVLTTDTSKAFTYTPTTGEVGNTVRITVSGTGAFTASHFVDVTIVAAPFAQILVCGDSIGAGYDNSMGGDVAASSWPSIMAGLLNAQFTQVVLNNVSADGALTTRYSTSGAWTANAAGHYDATKAYNICVISIGTNDIASASSAATIWSNIQAIRTQALAEGYNRFIVATLLPRSLTGHETIRQALHTLIYSNWRTYFDALLDFGRDGQMGSKGSELNSTYYNLDGIHPKAAGYLLMGRSAAGVIGQVCTNSTAAGGGSGNVFNSGGLIR